MLIKDFLFKCSASTIENVSVFYKIELIAQYPIPPPLVHDPLVTACKPVAICELPLCS